MISHSYFGNDRFAFDGRGRDLFWPYVLASVLLTLPTLGLCWIWFLARRRRFFWNHTWFERCPLPVHGGWRALLGLWLVNGLLLVLTLGFAWPWVRVRNIRFALRYLTLEGAARPRAGPPGGPRSRGDGGRPRQLPRHRLRPRLIGSPMALPDWALGAGHAPVPGRTWQGHYLDGETATRHPATVRLLREGLEVVHRGVDPSLALRRASTRPRASTRVRRCGSSARSRRDGRDPGRGRPRVPVEPPDAGARSRAALPRSRAPKPAPRRDRARRARGRRR